MRLVRGEEYLQFLESHDAVTIENTETKLCKAWTIERFEPKEFIPEEWTVWSFPQRGDWATHTGDFRGNWSPFIPRNLIHRFTTRGDLVCDPMMGSGTTLVECKLMGRGGTGVDINLSAVMMSLNRLDFEYGNQNQHNTKLGIRLFQGDARNLNEINDESIDLIATHPPYCNIISYSEVPRNLSCLELEDFVREMRKVATECFRVLKPDKHCAILIGDTRKHRHYVPIHVGILNDFLDAGFILREDIIKLQHNTVGAREKWTGHSYEFYKIAHEHLYVFRKPGRDEEASELRYSKRWW